MPQGFTAEASNQQVTLTWIPEENATYNLFYSRAPGVNVGSADTMKISDVSPPYPHTGLTNGTTYYYLLMAVNSAGESEPTVEISATPYIVQKISAGSFHTCAIVNDAALCWERGGKQSIRK